MRTNVMVIRQAIDRVVGLLARRKIKVTQRGSRAYVSYNKAGDVQEVNIPYLPDDASDDFVAAVQGFLDHEVGHVLFSSSGTLKRAVAQGARVANMANIIEDVFVERKMLEAFPGSTANLKAVREFYLAKMVTPSVTKMLAEGNTEGAIGYLIVVAFRAWGGQVVCADYLKDNGYLPLIENVAAALGDDIEVELAMLEHSDDCLKLAETVIARIKAFEDAKRAEEARKRAEQREQERAEREREREAEREREREAEERSKPAPGGDDDEPGGEPGDEGDSAPEPHTGESAPPPRPEAAEEPDDEPGDDEPATSEGPHMSGDDEAPAGEGLVDDPEGDEPGSDDADDADDDADEPPELPGLGRDSEDGEDSEGGERKEGKGGKPEESGGDGDVPAGVGGTMPEPTPA